MPDVSYHGWTHRPKAKGGTDPIEFPDMPFAYAWVGSFDAEDDTDYTLCAGDDSGFAGSALGVARQIRIGNDPDRETFFIVNPDTNKCLGVGPDARGLFLFEAVVLFSGGFDGVIELYPDSDFALWANTVPAYDGQSPVAGVTYPAKEWRVITSTDDHDASVRISSVVYLDATGSALSDMFSVIFTQRSGATQSVVQGWVLVTKLSDQSNIGTDYP